MNADDTGEENNDNRDWQLVFRNRQIKGPIIDFHQSQGQCTGGTGSNGPKEAARGKILRAFKELLKSSGTRMIKVRYHISFNKKHYAALSPGCRGTL